MAQNLMGSLLDEIERAQEICRTYMELDSNVAVFAAAVIQSAITRAKTAAGNGDVVAMLDCYHVLQKLKE